MVKLFPASACGTTSHVVESLKLIFPFLPECRLFLDLEHTPKFNLGLLGPNTMLELQRIADVLQVLKQKKRILLYTCVTQLEIMIHALIKRKQKNMSNEKAIMEIKQERGGEGTTEINANMKMNEGERVLTKGMLLVCSCVVYTC